MEEVLHSNTTNRRQSELFRLCSDILADQTAIWTSPFYAFRIHTGEWLWFTAGIAVLSVGDKRLTAALPKRSKEIAVSRWASRMGSIYTAGIVLLSVYVAGRMLDEARARELGLLGIRTLCNTELLGNPLKIVTQRPRPMEKGGSGRFWKGGYGFPSGHSMKSWALASLLAREFPHKRMIGVLAYTAAGTISLARVLGLRHFASDAFAGAVMGWCVGAFVERRHKERH